MISDSNIAHDLSQMLLDISGRIDESVSLVKDQCSDAEFQAYRKAAGIILGVILTEALNPIFKVHPEVAPPELRNFYNKPKS